MPVKSPFTGEYKIAFRMMFKASFCFHSRCFSLWGGSFHFACKSAKNISVESA